MRIKFIHIIVFAFASCVFCTSCTEQKEEPININDNVLASIEDKKLYLSEIAALIPENSTKEDSNRILTAFAENWAKEVVVLLNAEKSVSKDIDLNRLVKNYRESLVINNFEKDYIQRNLDTTVTESQVAEFYAKHKSNFIAAEPYVGFWFAKISDKKLGLDKFYENWKKGNESYITDYCEKNASVSEFKKEGWQPISQVKQFFPEALLKKIKFTRKSNFQSNFKDEEYFFSIYNVIKEGQPEPQSYIKDKLVKLVLHKRKTALLESLRSKLYNDAVKLNQIEFYDIE